MPATTMGYGTGGYDEGSARVDKAAQYGAAGAAAGSALGPLGTIVGGAGGAIIGAVTGGGGGGPPRGAEMAFDKGLSELGNYGQRWGQQNANQYANRSGPAMQATSFAGPDFAQAQQIRGQQMGALDLMGARARGEAPSAAEMQMRAGMERALAAQYGMAASARGGNVGAANRLMSDQSNAIRMQGNQQAAELRAQEQAAAEQRYMQALMGVRGQDTQQSGMTSEAAMQNAQLLQGANANNLTAALQTQGMNDAMVRYYVSSGMTYDEANRQAQMDQARLQAEITLGQMQANTQKEAAMYSAMGSAAAGLGSAAGGAASKASDRRAKKGVRRADDAAESMLNALASYSFEYREPEKHGAGRQLGVMAQDLERSNLGRALVTEREGTKMVDLGKATMAALAAAANLNKRLRAVEHRNAA